MKSKLIFCGLLLSFSHEGLSAESCPREFRTYQEIVFCAESRSPEIQRETLATEFAKGQVLVAEQWRNPDVSVDSFHGGSAEADSETDIALGIPIEWGGKLSARRSVAEGSLAQSEARLEEVRMKVRSEIYVKLHRLRQLKHEKDIIDEAISTFSQLVTQYSRRPTLSAEQEISQAVFRMSKSEYELKRLEILDEQAGLDSFFAAQLGFKTEISESILPKSPKPWPILSAKASEGLSPGLKVLEAELETSRAELSLAQSASWPALTLGPSVKLKREAGKMEQLYGLNLSFPLPVFNLNGAGRKAAQAGIKLTEAKRNLTQLEETLLVQELRHSYEQTVKVLGSTLSHESIEAKHKSIDRLFLKGMVPSSLVIESHRTFLELEKSRNIQELKAISALQKISFLQGQKMELSQ